MNANARLELAGKVLLKVSSLKDERRSLGNQIEALNTDMETAIIQDDDASMDSLRKLLEKIKHHESQRSNVNAEVTKYSRSLEDIILGKGDYDVSQMDFSDIGDLEEARDKFIEAHKPKEKDDEETERPVKVTKGKKKKGEEAPAKTKKRGNKAEAE